MNARVPLPTSGIGITGGASATDQPGTPAAASWRLEVLTGLHAGAVHMLAAGDCQLGKSLESDIVLFDTALPGGAFGTLHLAGNGSLALADVPQDAQGLLSVTQVSEREHQITCGPVIARLLFLGDLPVKVAAQAAAPTQVRHHAVAPKAVLVLLAVALSCGFAAVTALNIDSPRPEALAPPAAAKPRVVRNAVPAAKDLNLPRVALSIQQSIGEPTVYARAIAGGIFLTGQAKSERTQATISRIVKEYQGQVEILDQVEYVEVKRKIAQTLMRQIAVIKASEEGMSGYVELRNGTKIYPRSSLADGMELLHIGADHLVISGVGKIGFGAL